MATLAELVNEARVLADDLEGEGHTHVPRVLRQMADALEHLGTEAKMLREDAALGRMVREKMERGLAARERGEMKPWKYEAKRQVDTLEQSEAALVLLQEAHNKMDDRAVEEVEPHFFGCSWCKAEGYDANGLRHFDDCILVRMRKVLSDHAR